MTDKVIRVNVTSSKSQKVTVSSSKVANEITASPDTSAYYSRLAKNWAVAEGLVENIDYSSKYYAQESKASADMAKTYETATQENYNMFMESSFNANSELQTNRDGALADIEGAKTSAIDSLNSIKDENISTIESKANEEIENFENLSEQEQNKIINLGIDTRANVDLSNLTQEGEKHFLNKSQITNCITEIPQRIKYTLEDGVLTLLAGSVVIVPYGVEDLTSQYPKGATFLHENFKVYDTQFADGKFFVWAELQSDVTQRDRGLSSAERFAFITLYNPEYPERNGYVDFGTTPDMLSGTTSDISKYTSGYFYDIDQNKMVSPKTKNIVVLSFGLVIGDFVQNEGLKNIKQCFNGMGYFGSTVWVDKGVKGLIPNGRNEDGTLNNIEYTTDKIYMRTFTDTVNLTQETLVFTPFNPEFSYFRGTPRGFEITQDGFIYSPYRDEILKGFVALSASSTNGKITNFTPKLPFRAIDYSDKQDIIAWNLPDYSSGIQFTYTTASTEQSYTIPNDGVISYALTSAVGNGKEAYIKVNGSFVVRVCSPGANYLGQTSGTIAVAKGDVIKLYGGYTDSKYDGFIFFPLKGAN